MKTISYKILVAMLLCCNQVFAQNVLLPYGQDSKEPWEAKYYHAQRGENISDENWFAEDFDDSGWESLLGPISTETSTRLPYYETLWQDEYSTYWVRRHFTVNDINNNRILYFRAIHDDGCEAYLNGHLIYNYNGVGDKYVDVTEAAKPYLKKGDNVIAVKVSDTGGLYAYMDFGLTGSMLYEPEFNSNNGWSGNYDRHGYDGNNIGYKYGGNWICQQSLSDMPAGMYHLSANACGLEYYGNFNNAYNSRENALSAKLFINNAEKSIPNAFSEIAETRIYDYAYWEVDGGYVPYYVDCTPAAIKRGMYQTQLFSFYEPDSTNTMNVGIRCYPENNIDRWAAWDNINLVYIEEGELATMLDSLVLVHKALSEKHQDKTVKEVLDDYLSEAATAKTYKEKGQAYANMSYYEPTVRKTVEAYERLYATYQQLTDSLKKSSEFTSPATVAEATEYAATVLAAYNDGTYDNNEVATAISTMNKLMQRLSYLYLDITVKTPGAMGDSILAKVENFVDVYSLKVSGSLNSADLGNIQSRLTNLREIDMTDVEMTALPNRFFYQRKALEIVKLPKQLVSIGEYAFYQCYGLKHIDFPATLTTIYNYGFSECDNLQEVILPEGFTSLGERAFYSCDNNKYVKLPSTLKTLNYYTFNYNVNLKTVDFSEGLTHINDGAFYECYALNNLKFPATLYYIGGSAFAYNRALSNVEFNEGLYQIADNAFYDCDALTEVTLPSTLVFASASPFDYCDNLMKVTCLSIEPPYMTDQIPYGLSMTGRELYVPALSINTYKQTVGWDKFPTIKPIEYLPEHITVLGDLFLTLPENMSEDYKPTVDLIHAQKGSYLQYGQLTVNGEGTLSMSDFSMVWDPNYLYNGYDRYSPCYSSLVNNSHLRSDKVSIRTYARNDRWTFVSFPFDVKVSDIETIADGTTNWVIRKYDGKKRADGETNDTWIKMTGDDVLNAGEGYIIQGSRYIGTSWQDYSGYCMKAINNANKNNIFRTSDIVVSLKEYQSEFAHNRSWNLIGNPYPSFYDTRFMDFSAPITVWNINNNTYSAYSPVDDSYILCPGEAFFVQRPVDAESITFGKDGRQTNRSVRTLNAPARVKGNGAVMRSVINLSISDSQTTDRTRVVINENAMFDYEADKDAPKFMSTDNSVPQLYTTLNGVDYAINERPLGEGSVALAARFGANGQYTIALENDVNGCEVVLEDKLTGKKTTLGEGKEYDFYANAGETSTRFVLHLDNSATVIDSVANEETEAGAYYTIDGVKVAKPARRGIYILNNKKVVVK